MQSPNKGIILTMRFSPLFFVLVYYIHLFVFPSCEAVNNARIRSVLRMHTMDFQSAEYQADLHFSTKTQSQSPKACTCTHTCQKSWKPARNWGQYTLCQHFYQLPFTPVNFCAGKQQRYQILMTPFMRYSILKHFEQDWCIPLCRWSKEKEKNGHTLCHTLVKYAYKNINHENMKCKPKQIQWIKIK